MFELDKNAEKLDHGSWLPLFGGQSLCPTSAFGFRVFWLSVSHVEGQSEFS